MARSVTRRGNGPVVRSAPLGAELPVMAIKHLVLHVGVPKTGTSLIQPQLRTLRPQLRRRGIAYVDRRQMQRLVTAGPDEAVIT